MSNLNKVSKNAVSEQGSQDTNKETATEVKITPMVTNFVKEQVTTAQDRIKRLEQFQALSTRFEKLKEKENDLKVFKAGNDKMSANVKLHNSQGNEVLISNSFVIEKIIVAAETELNILITETENEILNFVI